MLLKETPKEIKDRTVLTINPAKTCQPIGAMYASLGVHGCFPHSHGSQGCCAYHRSALTRHYKDPIMAGTSSFTEGASVFGGQANLLQAINNIFTIYKPDLIAVHTTCLSETIGDDIPQIIGKAKVEGKIPEGKMVIHTSTPSYVGSHVTGFSNMTKSLVSYFAENTGQKLNQLNILPGWVEPSDMREIKRLVKEMEIPFVMFPDTSDVVDTPLTGKFEMFPKGGTTISEIRSSGDSRATIALGRFTSGAAAKLLDTKCKVPCEILDLPIGLTATDRFIDTLQRKAGVSVPISINDERGRLVDVMADMHQYLYGKRVALAGDPDQLLALIEFLITLDMKPVYIVTGTPGKAFMKRLSELTDGLDYEIKVKQPGDMFTLHQWIKNESVDLIMGNTYVKYIAKDEDIPYVRFGFPIYDRIGHSYFPVVGYGGGLRLLEKILGVLMDRIERDAPDESFELVM